MKQIIVLKALQLSLGLLSHEGLKERKHGIPREILRLLLLLCTHQQAPRHCRSTSTSRIMLRIARSVFRYVLWCTRSAAPHFT